MMEQLETIVWRIIYPIIEVFGSRAQGNKRRFPWALKQFWLGPGRVRTVVRLPGTRIFLPREDANGFIFKLYIWQEEGWSDGGMLFAQRNEEGGLHISDVLIYQRGKGYGTLLVKACLDVASAIGASHVEGYLSPVDDVPRLAIFYGRLGFDVSLSEAGNEGHIFKRISRNAHSGHSIAHKKER